MDVQIDVPRPAPPRLVSHPPRRIATDNPTPMRRRTRLGAITVEVRRARTPQTQKVAVSQGNLAIVATISGWAKLFGSVDEIVRDSTIAVLAKPGTTIVIWSADTVGIVVHLPRPRAQVLVSTLRNGPVRIATVDVLASADAVLSATLAELADWVWDATPRPEQDHARWRETIENAIVASLNERSDWSALLATPRAIQHAVAAIRTGAETDLDPAALAAGAGVTLRTLRTGFSACFGLSLTTYIQHARLQKALERLASGYDSRPMNEVARAAGFRSASNFARAYQRLFKETPTQTRTRAVRDAPRPTAKD